MLVDTFGHFDDPGRHLCSAERASARHAGQSDRDDCRRLEGIDELVRG
jgi:hypothetical protein